MYTVFGAGSVGTVLATFLADAGIEVAIAGRGAVSQLLIEGDEEQLRVDVPVVDEPEGHILLCVHEPQVAALTARWPGRSVSSFANGVSEVEGVSAAVWRMTCTLVRPGLARFVRRGRVIVSEPSLARELRTANLDVGCADDISADRWLKLLVNLASAPNALVRKQDHGSPEFGEAKAWLLEEALELYRANGIEASSCDGRDAAPEDEIARQRAAGGRLRPVYNSLWRLLSRGLPPAERYHDVIVGLGHAPRNAAMLRLLDEARAPECYSARDVFSALRDA